MRYSLNPTVFYVGPLIVIAILYYRWVVRTLELPEHYYPCSTCVVIELSIHFFLAALAIIIALRLTRGIKGKLLRTHANPAKTAVGGAIVASLLFFAFYFFPPTFAESIEKQLQLDPWNKIDIFEIFLYAGFGMFYLLYVATAGFLIKPSDPSSPPASPSRKSLHGVRQ